MRILLRLRTLAGGARFGTFLVAVVAAIGIMGIRSAMDQATVIAGGELTTAVATDQLARNIDTAYATGEAALQSADPAEVPAPRHAVR